MKPSICFLLSLLVGNTCHAQTWEKVDQRTESVIYQRCSQLANGHWLIGGWANPSGGILAPMYFIKAIIADGSTAWEQPLLYDVHSFGDMHPYPDGGAVTSGFPDYCDVWDQPRLMRIGNDGAIIWEKVVETSDFQPPRIAVNTQGLIALAFDTLFLFDTDGELITAFQRPPGVLEKIIFQNDSTLLLLVSDQLHQLDLTGVPMSTPVSVDPDMFDLQSTPSHALLLKDDFIVVLDHQLDLITQHDLSAIAPVIGFVEEGTGTHLFTSSAVYSFDPINGYSLVDNLESIPDHEVVALGMENGDLFTFGNQNIQDRSSAAARRRQLNQTLEYDEDVEILLSIDSIWAQPFQNPTHWDERANLLVSLVNHNSTTINKVVLSHRTGIPVMLCGPPATTFILNDLDMVFGDTLEISLEDVQINVVYANPNTTTADRTICLAALAPNNKLDRDPSDNYGCATTTITYPVGMDEQCAIAGLSVFPNPFHDQVTIDLSSTSNERTLLIHDASGRSVLSQDLAAETGTFSIDLSWLQPGVYTISIASEGALRRSWMIKRQ